MVKKKQELYVEKLERLIDKGYIALADIKDPTLKTETDKSIKAKKDKTT